MTRAADRNTGAPFVSRWFTSRCRTGAGLESLEAAPSVSFLLTNASHVSIHRAYSSLDATSAGARCTTHASSPILSAPSGVPSPSASFVSATLAFEFGFVSSFKCADVGQSITMNLAPFCVSPTTSDDLITRPSGNVTSSPRTSCPRILPLGTPSVSALFGSNLPVNKTDHVSHSNRPYVHK